MGRISSKHVSYYAVTCCKGFQDQLNSQGTANANKFTPETINIVEKLPSLIIKTFSAENKFEILILIATTVENVLALQMLGSLVAILTDKARQCAEFHHRKQKTQLKSLF